jgi:hypothetical protein
MKCFSTEWKDRRLVTRLRSIQLSIRQWLVRASEKPPLSDQAGDNGQLLQSPSKTVHEMLPDRMEGYTYTYVMSTAKHTAVVNLEMRIASKIWERPTKERNCLSWPLTPLSHQAVTHNACHVSFPPQRVNCHVNNPQAHCSCCSYHVFTSRPTPWLSLFSFEGPTRRALAHPGICNYVDRPQR